MNIDFCSPEGSYDRVLITLSSKELDGYGVCFEKMSLNDKPTRAMLDGLLAIITELGLRTKGDRVTIDCAPSDNGGCALLFVVIHPDRINENGVPDRLDAALPSEHADGLLHNDLSRPQIYCFGSSDDIISAYLAGALPAKFSLTQPKDTSNDQPEGWTLVSEEPLSAHQVSLLHEYCDCKSAQSVATA